MSLFTNDGSLVIDGDGDAIDCGDCPCDGSASLSTSIAPGCDDACPDGVAECFELTVAGVTDNACTFGDCTPWNGTFVLVGRPRIGGEICLHDTDDGDVGNVSVLPLPCVGSASGTWQLVKGVILWQLEAVAGTTHARYEIPGNVFDCHGSTEFALVFDDTTCTNWPSTLTLQAVACP